MLSLSQETLGEAIGLTFQQVQNYEHGVSQIGASRLYELIRMMDVQISFFFDDTDPVRAQAIGGFAEPAGEAFEADPLRKAEALELVQVYLAIEDATVRQHLMSIFKNFDKYSHPLRIRRLERLPIRLHNPRC